MSVGKKITDEDIIIGKRIALERTIKGISRHGLANLIEITHQQLQKYEHAENRITIGMLFKIAKALKVSVYELLEPIDIPPVRVGKMNLQLQRDFMGLDLEKQDLAIRMVRAMRGGESDVT